MKLYKANVLKFAEFNASSAICKVTVPALPEFRTAVQLWSFSLADREEFWRYIASAQFRRAVLGIPVAEAMEDYGFGSDPAAKGGDASAKDGEEGQGADDDEDEADDDDDDDKDVDEEADGEEQDEDDDAILKRYPLVVQFCVTLLREILAWNVAPEGGLMKREDDAGVPIVSDFTFSGRVNENEMLALIAGCAAGLHEFDVDNRGWLRRTLGLKASTAHVEVSLTNWRRNCNVKTLAIINSVYYTYRMMNQLRRAMLLPALSTQSFPIRTIEPRQVLHEVAFIELCSPGASKRDIEAAIKSSCYADIFALVRSLVLPQFGQVKGLFASRKSK